MTFGLVEAGEIMGILFCWQMGAASRDFDEATSPSTATTLSCEISLRTMVAGCPAMGLIVLGDELDLFPSTPPRFVDFLDGEFGALVGRLAETSAAAGERGVFSNGNFIWAKTAETEASKASALSKVGRSMTMELAFPPDFVNSKAFSSGSRGVALAPRERRRQPDQPGQIDLYPGENLGAEESQRTMPITAKYTTESTPAGQRENDHHPVPLQPGRVRRR